MHADAQFAIENLEHNKPTLIQWKLEFTLHIIWNQVKWHHQMRTWQRIDIVAKGNFRLRQLLNYANV